MAVRPEHPPEGGVLPGEGVLHLTAVAAEQLHDGLGALVLLAGNFRVVGQVVVEVGQLGVVFLDFGENQMLVFLIMLHGNLLPYLRMARAGPGGVRRAEWEPPELLLL